MMRNNRKILALLSIYSAILMSCSAGTSTSSPNPPPSSYTFTKFQISSSITDAKCDGPSGGTTKDDPLTYTCQTNGANLQLTISYTSNPASYVVIPTTLPANTALTHSGACSGSPVSEYNCTFNITSSGAASGSAINLPINGSLGQIEFLRIKFQ